MSPTDFRKLLHAAPFRPFRVHVSDGRTFDVRHPEMVRYTKNTLFLAVFSDLADRQYRYAAVGLLHVTGTTPLSMLEPAAA